MSDLGPTDDAMGGTQRACAAWFGTEGVSLTALGAGGFSGSHVFLVRRSTGAEFVLKSFAAGTPPERAAWIHALLRHLRALDAGPVPEVFPVHDATLAAPAANTLVCDDAGTLWELMQFVRGTPRHTPSADEAGAALTGLASLHAAAAKLPCAGPALERSSGVARRIEQARRILADPWRGLEPAAAGSDLAAVRPLLARAVEILESQPGRRAIERVAATEPGALRVQAVLRDVWSDHVLFAADGRLAGFIDFHAAGRDTPASDLARLLGSWDAADASVSTGPAPLTERWRHALAAYEAVCPLSPQERRLIPWLDATGVICGLDNWFRWLVTDRRRFADSNRVLARIEGLLRRLPDALEGARDPFPGRD